jgi:phosphoribosylformimino-5-aminoimidazole carboxamide ribotide isomerase
MQLIPSIDLRAGRSRLVFWPGAASGIGTPTDRPERIARHFVEAGAPSVHLVDLDGAARGVPVATEAIAAVARAVAVPLQLAGGVDGPQQIELAFAAGATRVVVPLWRVIESPSLLADCLGIAGDWLAVGVDGRAERLTDYPWRDGRVPGLQEIVTRMTGAGVRRIVLSHWQRDGLEVLVMAARSAGAEVQLAGGVTDTAELAGLRDDGVSAVIVGEALFTGAIDYAAGLQLLGRVGAAGAA